MDLDLTEPVFGSGKSKLSLRKPKKELSGPRKNKEWCLLGRIGTVYSIILVFNV
jgi:hypothetical protein